MSRTVSIIGAGSLGLGLLYPWAASSGGSVGVINRHNPKPDKQYRSLLSQSKRFVIQTQRGHFEHGPLDLLEYDEDNLETERSRACIQRLASSDVVMVSVGVRNLASVSRLIAEACKEGGESQLHLFAFENTPAATSRLEQLVARNLSASDPQPSRPIKCYGAVPDRACSSPQVSNGAVAVTTETFGEIILADSARDVVPFSIGTESVPSVQFVSEITLPLYELRKFWLVNGTHLALGVFCARANLAFLQEALRHADVMEFVKGLHVEWIAILDAIVREQGVTELPLSRATLASHASRIFDRLQELPDWGIQEVLRELAGLTGEGDERYQLTSVARLLEKIDMRLGRQLREAHRFTITDVPYSAYMLAEAVKMVQDYTEVFTGV